MWTTPTRCCATGSRRSTKRPCCRRGRPKSALGLLADRVRWISHFDAEWRRTHASDWKQHHAYLQRVRQRATALAAGAGRNSADEIVEWADCERRLDARADVRGHYERALQVTPDHAGA